ncbi:competence type IV pilus minor pilin ComGF [Bacillus sp. SCS-153A]|uniref:competence type IV pilus minor pilin ComGF n=1 Tax=Rossellomorea sedimentorum TaxID=3115294 RepID=UPI0039068597
MTEQGGYTLLQAIFTLCVFMVIASCFPVVITGITLAVTKLDPSKEYEWNLFSHQFRQEFRGATGINVTDYSIKFMKEGQEITYEKYGEFIRRRVDRRGHEIVLGPIDSVELKKFKNGVEIHASFEGTLHIGRFLTYGQ